MIFLFFFSKNRTDYTIRRELVQRILKEKGQTLVVRLLHASVFSLSSYMLSDVADVFNELSVTNRQVRTLILSNFCLLGDSLCSSTTKILFVL